MRTDSGDEAGERGAKVLDGGRFKGCFSAALPLFRGPLTPLSAGPPLHVPASRSKIDVGSGRSLNDQERRLRDVIRAVRLHRRLSVHFSDRDPLFEPGYSTFQPAKKEANVPNIATIADTPLVTYRYRRYRRPPAWKPGP